MRIGNLRLDGKVLLAPMCDVTNVPFRLICREYGAALVYSEMINADAFVMKSKKTRVMASFVEEERPIGIQVMGSKKEVLRKAVIKIEKDLKPNLIDINLGCPSYNVIRSGSGSELLKDLNGLGELINLLSTSLNIPFTCKMRILSKDTETIKAAKIIENSGAAALTVHGRTAKQKYSGKANWKIIKKIKKELKIPVILNGDVVDEESAKKAFDYTKCDGVMIGRAAIGNPYLFKRINYFLRTGKKLQEQQLKSKITEMLEIYQKYPNYSDLKYLKRFSNKLTKGLDNGSKLRKQISESKNKEQLFNVLITLPASK